MAYERPRMDRCRFWWEADEEDLPRMVFDHVEAVEQEQSALFTRFLQYACLYDPHERLGLGGVSFVGTGADAYVADNVIQSAVDTAASIVAKNRPRISVNTDGADWGVQRQAKWLDQYLEGNFRAVDLYELRQESFVDGCVFGTGAVKLTPSPRGGAFDAERVLIDEIIADERECRGRRLPRQLHQRKIADREELAALFPDHEEEILEQRGEEGTSISEGFWADYRPLELNQTIAIESWRLPFYGADGELVAGRHTICTRGVVLEDEPWQMPWFPFIFTRWARRRSGFYGRGIAEELAGRQNHINRMNWQFDRRLQQIAVPRHFVHIADAKMSVRLVNTAGAVIPYRKEKPHTFIPTAVSGEEWARLEKIIAGGLQQVGISPFSARAQKPAGVESGAAMREVTDTESERFARNSQDWEHGFVEAAQMMIAWAKTMKKPPVVPWKAKSMSRMIEWSKVDIGDAPHAIKLDPAGALARTPAGRLQRVIELAQSGLVGSDEARRLLEHPDIKRQMDMANAAMETAERELELLLDGEYRTPDPLMNLPLTAGRITMGFNAARNDGAPEEILDNIASYIENCIELMKPKAAPAPAMPMDPLAAAGPAPMAGPGPMPAQPVAALAPEAMNLQAA